MNKEPSPRPSDDERQSAGRNPGISNRESAEQEAAERAAHPPVDTNPPPPEDAAGRVGDEPSNDESDLQTSLKSGSRSTAQKETGARYPDRAMPASQKVAGAFGKEPDDSRNEQEPQ